MWGQVILYKMSIWVGFLTSPLSDERLVEIKLKDKKLWPKQMWHK
jgi:hypothetical protein